MYQGNGVDHKNSHKNDADPYCHHAAINIQLSARKRAETAPNKTDYCRYLLAIQAFVWEATQGVGRARLGRDDVISCLSVLRVAQSRGADPPRRTRGGDGRGHPASFVAKGPRSVRRGKTDSRRQANLPKMLRIGMVQIRPNGGCTTKEWQGKSELFVFRS